MQKRKRILSPIFSTKEDGTLIRRGQVQLSYHKCVENILRELGRDPKEYFRDAKWRAFCRANALGISLS